MVRLLAALLCAAAALITATTPATASARAAAVADGGFETGDGWRSTGTAGAAFIEAGGHSGGMRLTHYASGAYRVETAQTLTRLADGPYTLRAWVRSGGGQRSVSIGLRDCGGEDARTEVPVTPDWVEITVSATVTRHRCTISLSSGSLSSGSLSSDAPAGAWANFDDVRFEPGAARLAIRGADVSSLAKSEALGGVYRYADGRRGDPLAILRHGGLNYIRLKVWVNPADGYNTKAQVLAIARRAKAQGLGLLVDFHYSDSWADPGKQNKPAAWESLPFDELRQALYDHTYDVLRALKAQGTTADMVQVGNEINGGLLWPDGRWDNWPQLAALLNAGYDAVKAVSGDTKVVLHLANGGDNGLYRWWFDTAATYGVRYDVIGLSYYPYWHGTLAAFQTNLNDVAARYGKPVAVVETAYPFTTADDDGWENNVTAAEPYPGYPATPEGQRAFVRDLTSIVRAVPGGRGLGAFYWEATWTGVKGNGWDPADPASGNAWENQALFGFDDRALPALREFGRR